MPASTFPEDCCPLRRQRQALTVYFHRSPRGEACMCSLCSFRAERRGIRGRFSEWGEGNLASRGPFHAQRIPAARHLGRIKCLRSVSEIVVPQPWARRKEPQQDRAGGPRWAPGSRARHPVLADTGGACPTLRGQGSALPQHPWDATASLEGSSNALLVPF